MAAKVDFTTGSTPYEVATGDIDGDGKPDILVGNSASNTVSVFRNTATSGTITSGSLAAKVDFTTGTFPFGVAVGDLNGDGKADIAVINYNSNTVSVFTNTATSGTITSGSLAAKVDYTAGTNPSGIAIGDMDGDGKPEIVFANQGSTFVSVLHNNPPLPLVTLTGGSPQSLTLCNSGSAVSVNSLLTTNDITGLTQTWTVTSGPAHGTMGGFPATASSGSGVSPTGTTYTPTGGYGGADAFTIQVSDGSTTATTVINVTVTAAGTWLGGTSTTWATSGNWCGGVPTSTTNVVIPTGATFYPVITTGTGIAKNLTIQTSATLTVNGGALQIGGALSNSGTFTATSGSIEMNGSSAQTIPANTFASNTIQNLKINNSAGVSLSGSLKVTGTYTPTSGTLTTGGFLTLASNSSGTANVAVGSSGGSYVSGNVTVERYIAANAGRAWRLLSANTTGSQTIHAAWQEGASVLADPNPGYGTVIDCDSRYSTSNGFDEASLHMSILAFDVTGQSFTTNPVTNTNVKTFSSEPGYFVYMRGERTKTSSNTGSSATILRSTGSLLMGDQSAITVPASQYVLVGNPFASTIDFSLISPTDRTNVGNRVWLWDPKLTGSYGVGGYTLVDASTVPAWAPSVTGGSYSSAISTIPSGMAFFVKGSAGTGSLTLRENIKVAGNSNNGFRLTGSTTEQFQVIMSVVNPDGSQSNADGVFALFDDKYSIAVDDDDANKLSNTGENLSILRNGTALSLEARPVVATDDTVYLGITGMKPLNYRFTVTPTGFSAGGFSTGIVDNYLNTFTPIDLSAPTTYDFAVNADNGSFDQNRFYIGMHQSTSGQPNVTAENGITVYPNPTDNAHINVQFTNMEKGTYGLTLYNAIGQKTLTETVIYPGGTVTKQLRSENITPGMYHLSVDKNASFYKSFKIIITQ